VNLSRSGSHHPNIRGGYGVYETSDGGAILLATSMQLEAYDALCIFAEIPELAIDPRVHTPGQRLGEGLDDDDSQYIRDKLAEGFRKKTAAQWDAFLRTQPEIIWERVRTYTEVLEDPQNVINGYVSTVDVPGVGDVKTVGNLVSLSETPGSTKGAPPQLGADNEELLAWAGMEPTAIQSVTAHAAAAREALLAEAAQLNEALAEQISAIKGG